MQKIYEKLRKILKRYDELEEILCTPGAVSDPAKLSAIVSEQGRLSKYVIKYKELAKIQKQKEEALELIQQNKDDRDLIKLAHEEYEKLTKLEHELTGEIEDMLSEPEELKRINSLIMEIRPAAGGQEAALFAYDLLRMYLKLADRRGWKVETLDISKSDLGGIKFASIFIEGQDCFKILRFEAGCHRVQRVPVTEASGRIHTSTCTVAILPEADEVEVNIKKDDLEIDTFRAGGPGGQHVNRTYSAVRIKHKPTGITVVCQSDRSQHRNRELALKWLKAKIYERYKTAQGKQIASLRKSQIGTGERSEKIRTYNYMQNRITDHRISYSIYNRLREFLDGEIDEITQKLMEQERRKYLEGEDEENKDNLK